VYIDVGDDSDVCTLQPFIICISS